MSYPGMPVSEEKYKSKAILANDADPATLLPQFGKKEDFVDFIDFSWFRLF